MTKLTDTLRKVATDEAIAHGCETQRSTLFTEAADEIERLSTPPTWLCEECLNQWKASQAPLDK